MPSSTPKIITPIVEKILQVKPKTILDIGFGYGKWGYLSREYLESWQGRIEKREWKIKITGIDAYEPLSKLGWINIFYDKIITEDALVAIKKLGNYDLVIATDVLEHLEKKASVELFDECYKQANKSFIVSIPLGEGWLNNYVPYENKYDKHRCVWYLEEIKERRPNYLRLIQEPKGLIALAFFDK